MANVQTGQSAGSTSASTNRTAASSVSAPDSPRSLAELIDELSHFDGPPDEFLQRLLAQQCAIAEAKGGAIVRQVENDGVELLAIHPAGSDQADPPAWLSFAFRQAHKVCSQAVTTMTPLRQSGEMYGQSATQYLVMLPLLGDAGVRGAEAFVIDSDDLRSVNSASQRLELTICLLNLYELRLSALKSKSNLGRLSQALEVIASANQHDRLTPAAMAFCNQTAAQWRADRVSLGLVRHHSVHAVAMSHTNRFSRKMKLVQTLEAAMEESVDQDVEIAYPAASDAHYVCRAAGELSARYGPTMVLSFPLRRQGEPVAVLTVERPIDQPFDIKEVESLRLLCELSAARLMDLARQDRWFGAKMADAGREAVSHLVGPKHTWMKLAASALFAAAVFFSFANTADRVESTFALEAPLQRSAPAPFDGYLMDVFVEPGDHVTANETVLAVLDTAPLQLRLRKAAAEHVAYLTQADQALKDGKKVNEQVARAQARMIQAEVDLLEDQIRRATIIAPISGVVLTGDHRKRLDAPIKTGELLFELAPLDSLRASLWVPEERIADVKIGQTGELAAASHPDQHVRFVVDKIHPVAQVVAGRNVFRIEVRLAESRSWMRPGMEGVAKIDAGRKKMAWIWTRGLVNWLRMKLWV